jgi:hypothetical protein
LSSVERLEHRPTVVSLATHAHHLARLTRLEASLRDVGFRGEVMCWRGGELPPGAPAHADVPFGFKPFCLAEARRRGCRLLLWLDASCAAVRSLEPLFAQIERDGYVLFRNGRHRVGEWASDLALELLSVDRDQAMAIHEVNAAAIGVDGGSVIGSAFLDRWRAVAEAGDAFRGVREALSTEEDYQAVKWNRDGRVSADPRVRGHRHDQSVAGILAAQLGMQLTDGGIEAHSPRTRILARSTRIVVVRDAAREGAAPASLRRLRTARLIGATVPRLRSRRRHLR